MEKTWKGIEYFLYDDIQEISYWKYEVPGGAPGEVVKLTIQGPKHKMYYKSHLSPLDIDSQLDQKVKEMEGKI